MTFNSFQLWMTALQRSAAFIEEHCDYVGQQRQELLHTLARDIYLDYQKNPPEDIMSDEYRPALYRDYWSREFDRSGL